MPDFDPDLLALANDLRVACQRIARRVRFESTNDLSPHLFSVLVCIRNGGPQTPTQLAAHDAVSTPSMTKSINCLADRGLVERSPHPDDGRQILVHLTDAGAEVIEQTIASRDTWMLNHIGGLDDDQLALLRKAADLLQEVAGAA